MICKMQYAGGSSLLLNTGVIIQGVLEISIVIDPESCACEEDLDTFSYVSLFMLSFYSSLMSESLECFM